jgi:hypothetical protein
VRRAGRAAPLARLEVEGLAGELKAERSSNCVEGTFYEVLGVGGWDFTYVPRCLACLRTPTMGRTQRGQHHESEE